MEKERCRCGPGPEGSNVSVSPRAASSPLSAFRLSALTQCILSADRHGTGYYKIGYFYTERNSVKEKYVKAGAYIFLL